MNKQAKPQQEIELIAKGERFLNRVLAYQAAIAVHQLKEEIGLDVEELALNVAPVALDTVGGYRVVCTIVRASSPQPVVLEVVIQPDQAIASIQRKSDG